MELNNILEKIVNKAKRIILNASLDYSGTRTDIVPYKTTIVINDKYKDFYFLVQENIHFFSKSISDSSYSVFSFDSQGNFVMKEDIGALGEDFFYNNKVLKVIE